MVAYKNTDYSGASEEAWSRNTGGKAGNIRTIVEDLRRKAAAEHGGDIETEMDVAYRDRSLSALFKKWAFGTDNLVRQTFSRIADVERTAAHVETMEARIIGQSGDIVARATHNEPVSSDTSLVMKKAVKAKGMLVSMWHGFSKFVNKISKARAARKVKNAKHAQASEHKVINPERPVSDYKQDPSASPRPETPPRTFESSRERTDKAVPHISGASALEITPVFVLVVAQNDNVEERLSLNAGNDFSPSELLPVGA